MPPPGPTESSRLPEESLDLVPTARGGVRPSSGKVRQRTGPLREPVGGVANRATVGLPRADRQPRAGKVDVKPFGRLGALAALGPLRLHTAFGPLRALDPVPSGVGGGCATRLRRSSSVRRLLSPCSARFLCGAAPTSAHHRSSAWCFVRNFWNTCAASPCRSTRSHRARWTRGRRTSAAFAPPSGTLNTIPPPHSSTRSFRRFPSTASGTV